MLNIVLFSGGSGSIAIQEGLSALYKDYNLDIVINAYDNGKSTGDCRKVLNSEILGPSDLRKNHLTQFKAQHGDKLQDPTSRESFLYSLFQYRFSADSKEEYYEKACTLLEDDREILGDEETDYLRGLVEYFFFEGDQVWRTTLEGIEFHDFAIANVFYSAAAAMNGNSMRLAGKKMAEFLGIHDNVHLISDVNLYLQAQTESGYTITDEEEIVAWNNPEDKIVSVTLLRDGCEYIPMVDEETDLSESRSIMGMVEDADIIIFSSGTQWSSLIPSYMHSGLRTALEASMAKKYLVMNNIEDQDMKGNSADDIIEILGRYIPMDDVTAVVNLDAVEGMNNVTATRCICGHIGAGGAKHNPTALIGLIMRDYFQLPKGDVTYVYDLDGTLWDERANNRGKAVGIENMNLFKGIIHSGNNYEHVRDVFKYIYHQETLIEIYTDFGAVHFTSADYTPDLLTDQYVIDSTVAGELEKIKEFRGKVKMRGEGCVITIKPLVNRKVLQKKAQTCLEQYGGEYIAFISGHTSLDIMHKDYNKKTMLSMILEKHGLKPSEVVFIGNEVNHGTEEHIKELGVQVIQVDDVYECNMLLKTIIACEVVWSF